MNQSRSIAISCTRFSLIKGSASSLGSRCTEPFCNRTDPMLSITSPKSLSTLTETFGSLGGNISCIKTSVYICLKLHSCKVRMAFANAKYLGQLCTNFKEVQKQALHVPLALHSAYQHSTRSLSPM